MTRPPGGGGKRSCMSWSPSVERRRIGQFGVEVRLGHPLLDDYLRFVAARCRPNTVLATGFDLKVFFTFTGKDPVEVTVTDVLDFIADQRAPRRGGNVVRLQDGEAGLSARTIRRRLASLSGLFGYLVARGLLSASPVPGWRTVGRGPPGNRTARTGSPAGAGSCAPTVRPPRPGGVRRSRRDEERADRR